MWLEGLTRLCREEIVTRLAAQQRERESCVTSP